MLAKGVVTDRSVGLFSVRLGVGGGDGGWCIVTDERGKEEGKVKAFFKFGRKN